VQLELNPGAACTLHDDDPDGRFALAIRELLRDHNAAHIGRPQWEPLLLRLEDAHGDLLAGLTGDFGLGWLHVDFLVVAPGHRGRGLGARLLQEAEARTRARGGLGVHLETLSFQALPFYLRQGYRVFGEQADNPPGHTRYYLEKRL
jgi:GNAT superfamily N-acetyltransferase